MGTEGVNRVYPSFNREVNTKGVYGNIGKVFGRKKTTLLNFIPPHPNPYTYGRLLLGESKAFGTFMNGFEEISSEFVVGFIGRQIQLIEAVKRTIRIRINY